VIGRGKLIADTSISKLVAGSSSGVFVRVTNPSALETALKKNGFKYEKEDNGLSVASAKTDDIGKLAHSAKIAVLELTPKTASLEQAFLELTEGAEEYQGQPEEGAKS